MWGTDMPSGICNDTYEHNIDWIMKNPLFTDNEKEDIFYNTANKVYFNE